MMSDYDVPTWIDSRGTVRRLGNNAVPESLKLATKGELPDIPKSEWTEFDFRKSPNFPVKVKDQGRYGACNGHAAASSLEIARWIAGYTHHDLSAWLVYADLCGGIDRGSNIAQALVHLESKGTCRESLVPHGTITPSRIMAAARQDALRFRVEIGYQLNSFNDLCIAAQLRQPFNFSVPVNADFNRLDSFGRPLNKSGAHNHAVTGGLGYKVLSNGEPAVLMLNSWGPAWGINGFCWISERNVQGWGWDAYSVVASHFDPEEAQPRLA